MSYWLNLTLFKMGFWLTWALIPIAVEIIPAFISGIQLFFKTLRKKQLTMPDKMPFISLIVQFIILRKRYLIVSVQFMTQRTQRN
ncbi:hypothetical protein MK904_08265 [Loigolactobacillus coryniformis]|uniref:hypothetical protein n=1 Tax=Loigolactobacillus coryniformis TaxID=1610 RepID=UPI00233FF4FC|nr:hypothetical protein [Loigolactobacillus coryniformis]MDC4186097.1 hypothetical protein [Loigolactobacillus coryniformis]